MASTCTWRRLRALFTTGLRFNVRSVPACVSPEISTESSAGATLTVKSLPHVPSVLAVNWTQLPLADFSTYRADALLLPAMRTAITVTAP